MREIRFRAWDKKNKRWDIGPFWVDDRGQIWEQPNRTYDTPNQEIVSTDELIIMQYTSLKDRNGKEIYEGDILRITRTGKETLPIEKDFVVKWDINCWNVPRISWIYEVIGNIYEGPHAS